MSILAERTDRGDPLPPRHPLPLDEAERFCAQMARREAKNFYWGFIALPRSQRMAIYALYDFARQVDDEADRPASERDPARLARHRERLGRCLAGVYDDPIMQLLGLAVHRCGIPADELEQVIEGVEMDLRQNRYHSWEELAHYCSLVASAIGRMCVRIFGYRSPEALHLADDLGLAMQLTNILRDVREDYHQFGRIYLPLDELEAFGIDEQALAARLADDVHGWDGTRQDWDGFVRFETSRARSLFASGLRVADEIPTASAACVLTMAGIYRGILREIERNPDLPLERRVSLSSTAKLRVVVRSWLQAASPS
ncbi:MAG: squalene/phytoene synthase family protein [Chloroflexi bacterium]|nr:squalene/phytoene synthase family protein [Chloroflexota bacterium]